MLRVKAPLNRPLKILLVADSLILLASAMLGPIYAIFVGEIGGDLLDAGYAFAVFSIAAGMTAYASGKYSDKTGSEELVVLVGYVILGISFFAYTLVNSVSTLLIVQVIGGLGTAIYSPSFSSLYSKHLDLHKEASEWGAWEVTYYFSTALGALAGGKIVTLFGFDVLFVIMGFLCFVSAIYIYLLPKRTL